MSNVYDYCAGDLPLLISIPHDGRLLAPDQENTMTNAGLALPDTDWHVRKLYGFANDLGASVIAANYSRYVIDLNRPATDEALYDGQVSTGLCPTETFAGARIYENGHDPTGAEVHRRIETYWAPYHARLQSELTGIRERFGYALLWDAHSIPTKVPRLFDGSLPDLNIGTYHGASCVEAVSRAVLEVAEDSPYSAILNGRFAGGHITRQFGNPDDRVHAVQLELAQHNYMNEESFGYDIDSADRLVVTIKRLLEAFLSAAHRLA